MATKPLDSYQLKVIFLQTCSWLILLCSAIFLIVTIFRPQWQQIAASLHPEATPAATLTAEQSPDVTTATPAPVVSESLIRDVIRAILDASAAAELASSSSDLSRLDTASFSSRLQ